MKGDVFLDTNILIYAVSADERKAPISEQLIARGGIISVQVLNEFVNAARRKRRASWLAINEMIESFRAALRVDPVTIAVHEQGMAIAQRYNLSIYDAMVAAAAQLAGCAVLYSEDMQNGLVIDSLSVRNPFK
jgi:predicted nucleic acid-binding protein